jgi:hypothetical protein
MTVVHAGFDGLKFTIQADIPPALRATLADAKAQAIKTNADCTISLSGLDLAVRRSGGSAFSAHTGEYGAEWYFLDPENRAPNNPGVTVDFRAFLLATGGLDAAQDHFNTCMAAFGIRHTDAQLRVSRVDFAVDILAPWFEPARDALVVPPGTHIAEIIETHAIGARVSGLRAGAIANRQLAIYDKRAEVIAKGKHGWLTIWNASLAKAGLPPLDLKDRDTSQVWRFELRMGSQQLRNRWEMRSWADLHAIIGDAFTDFTMRIRYTAPTHDRNRARWPTHALWDVVTDVIATNLAAMRSGVIPDDVKTANRLAHQRMLDGQILGLLVSRAAAGGIPADDFDAFIKRHLHTLRDASKEHPVPISERLARSIGRYRFK